MNEVAQLGQGECFGELGLIYKVKRTATAASLTCKKRVNKISIVCKLAVLEKDVFQKHFSGVQNDKVNTMLEFF